MIDMIADSTRITTEQSAHPNPVGSTSESISVFLARERGVSADAYREGPPLTGVFSEGFDPKEYSQKVAVLNGGVRIPYPHTRWTVPFSDSEKGNQKGKRPPTPVKHSLFSLLGKGITRNAPQGDL